MTLDEMLVGVFGPIAQPKKERGMNAEEIVRKLCTGEVGHFAAALGDAWCYADSSNRHKIEVCFVDLFRRVDAKFTPEGARK